MSATTAREFYGESYTKTSLPERLEKAFHWLNKAVEFEAEAPNGTKHEMAFKQALKCEAEAFA